jgi:hypothetical protein
MPPDASPDPVTAAIAARAAHKASCAPCIDGVPCSRLRDLTAEWRRALRDGSVNRSPVPDGGSG